MSSSRLQQQFIRLWQCCQGQSQAITLSQLAERLACTRRHMRNLLKAMQQEGWLVWHAESGRGKRSRLEFRLTGLALQQRRAEALLEEDRVDQLVQLVGDKNSVRQMLISYLGRSFRQGRHIFRVLYYRTLLNLLPGSPLRRTEKHLARQIFSGLTRINEENGETEADIAHHWQSLSALHWRFYIRPAIRFHHGRELDVSDIIASLTALKNRPLFTHLQNIDSPAPWTIDIHLTQPDHWLPWLLGSISAVILPEEWPTLENFARCPTGTGPYSVVANRPAQLQIQAFDDYFGYRALVDEVHIWVLPEISQELLYSGVKVQSPARGETSEESRLEEGGYFVLFDQRSAIASREDIRQWISALLNPITLLTRTGTEYQRYWFPAYGMLPCWHHYSPSPPLAKPAGLTSLTLTWYNEHIEYQAMANAIIPLLASQGVSVTCQQVNYATWHQGDAESDLWLGSINFTLPLAFSLFSLMYELPLLRHSIPIDWETAAQAWREQRLSLPEWHKGMVDEGWLHPLFHHWLSLEGERNMRDVRMNALGWFDFKSAWFAPPEL